MALGLGQPSRGAMMRRCSRPKLLIARAAAPIFSPIWGSTSITIGRRPADIGCVLRCELGVGAGRAEAACTPIAFWQLITQVPVDLAILADDHLGNSHAVGDNEVFLAEV